MQNSTEKKTWNRAVLTIDWQADRHNESHSIKFERPTELNPTPEHPVVKGRILSTNRLSMSSSWGDLFAAVKVVAFDEYSLTVQYGKTRHTVTPGKGVRLDTGGMSYTTFWLYLSVEEALEISGGEPFLHRFRLTERMRLSKDDIESLRLAAEKGNSAAEYGYARWLYAFAPTDEAIGEAEEYFKRSMPYIPDALASYALMLRYGDTKEHVMDLEQSDKLMQQAAERGSQRALQQLMRFRIFGQHCEAEPAQAATEIERYLEANPDADPYFHTLLGYAYEEMERTDDAIAQYEQAVAKGEYDSYCWMACIYKERGNMALYEELMEEGFQHGSGLCCTFRSDMSDEDFEQLPPREQYRLHNSIDSRLHIGLERGELSCAFYLWLHHYYGGLGYTENAQEATQYLKQAVAMGHSTSVLKLAELAEDGQWVETLNSTEIAELWLRAARYNPSDYTAMSGLKRQSDPAFLLRHKDELERYWQPQFERILGKPMESKPPRPEKTDIEPMVIIIWPTGHMDVEKVDVAKIASYREMGQQLIGADGLDAVRHTPLLHTVGEAAELDQPLVMYVDRDAQMKQLPDNAIGTLLYGSGEVRGPIIICLQDERGDCHSFTKLEDLVGTYNEINKHSGGLLIIKDEDDGKYDAYV